MSNITIDDIGLFFSGASLGAFFIKAFSIVFSVLLITYAIIAYKQVQDISRVIINRRNNAIIFISLLQVFIGLFLLFFAIFVV